MQMYLKSSEFEIDKFKYPNRNLPVLELIFQLATFHYF
ncbi:hypothetical protein BA6E_102312 [Bacteroidales bacterium 6E]|nr:hypothetical protein BA6E_102312 [Bacteroidales bacterium 6E]